MPDLGARDAPVHLRLAAGVAAWAEPMTAKIIGVIAIFLALQWAMWPRKGDVSE
jgi:hypothetical protein